MFFKSKSQNPKSVKFTTLIGEHTEVLGIVFTGALCVRGVVHGNVTPKHQYGDQRAGTVHVGPNGYIAGDVTATTIVVDGRIEGNINGGSVHLEAKSSVIGDIIYDTITIKAGADIKGRLIKREADGAATVAEETATMPLVETELEYHPKQHDTNSAAQAQTSTKGSTPGGSSRKST